MYFLNLSNSVKSFTEKDKSLVEYGKSEMGEYSMKLSGGLDISE